MDTGQRSPGRVYLVGAGPSDAGLLTIKGKKLLEQAEVVIYDALVGAGICSMIPEWAEKINVGKRCGKHSMKQEEISRLIVKKAFEGRMVVRLKGGDPFLFGRGGEEVEQLVAHQIPYEIVPGVTSALAVPAYAGIPLTHRDMASSVHIITGHKKQGQPEQMREPSLEALQIDFEALKRIGGTCVFLMGLRAMPDIVHGFLDVGMHPDTPAAVLSQGTGAGQQKVIATLATLVQETGRHPIAPPAVIVIGETAALGKKFAWYEKMPLFGKRILVTRPYSRSQELTDRLRGLGAEVIAAPSIQTIPLDCGDAFCKALSHIGDYSCLVFTSPAGVEYFFSLLNQCGRDIRCIGDIPLAVIGSATRDALKKYGLLAQIMPERYNSISLGKCINRAVRPGGRVLLMRSAAGSEQLIKEIQAEKQIEVTDLAIYDTIYVKNSALDIRALLEERPVIVLFASASSVRGFVRAAPGLDYANVRSVCIGQATAQEAAGYGMQVTVSAKETISDMVEAVLKTI